MAGQATLGGRAERTRASILEAAEALFAERGFAAARLEDVAERVGIKRASIVYYFRDKRELYDAVLASVFGGLLAEVERALAADDPLPERIEAGVCAWVDYVAARPTLARLVLREVADATPDRGPALLEQTRPFVDLIQTHVYDRLQGGDSGLAPVDPLHLASTVAGATVFFVAGVPALVPDLEFDPTSPEHVAAHREQVLFILRRLLGTRGPHRTRG